MGRLPYRTIALVALVAATVLLPPLDKPAGAHYGSPRLSICATSGKYGCASYQFTLVYTIYGNYYDNTHIHTCTDKGGDSSAWRQDHNGIAWTLNPPQLSWIVGQSSTTTNFTMCGATSGQFLTYNEPAGGTWWAYQGNNRYSVQTTQWFPGVTMVCLAQLPNFSASGSATYGNLAFC